MSDATIAESCVTSSKPGSCENLVHLIDLCLVYCFSDVAFEFESWRQEIIVHSEGV